MPCSKFWWVEYDIECYKLSLFPLLISNFSIFECKIGGLYTDFNDLLSKKE